MREPCALFMGQRIIGYAELKTGSLGMLGHWRAIVALQDETRAEIEVVQRR
jgi:hypothetical protein